MALHINPIIYLLEFDFYALFSNGVQSITVCRLCSNCLAQCSLFSLLVLLIYACVVTFGPGGRGCILYGNSHRLISESADVSLSWAF